MKELTFGKFLDAAAFCLNESDEIRPALEYPSCPRDVLSEVSRFPLEGGQSRGPWLITKTQVVKLISSDYWSISSLASFQRIRRHLSEHLCAQIQRVPLFDLAVMNKFFSEFDQSEGNIIEAYGKAIRRPLKRKFADWNGESALYLRKFQ